MALDQEGAMFSGIKLRNRFVMEDYRGEKSDDFDCLWDVNRDIRGNSHDCNLGKAAKVDDDIVDLLPIDPFDMDIHISTTVTTITGWIGDCGLKILGFKSSGELKSLGLWFQLSTTIAPAVEQQFRSCPQLEGSEGVVVHGHSTGCQDIVYYMRTNTAMCTVDVLS